MGNAIWLVICGAKPGTGTFRIKEGVSVIGRGTGCDIYLPHPKVSRRHAELVNENGKLSIRDLQSRNGTFVNDKPIESADITADSSLRIGDVSLDVVVDPFHQFDSADDSEATPRTPVQNSAGACLRAARFGPARKQVLSLLLDGLAEKQIAVRLGMRERTVHWHVREIYEALDVHARGELAAHFRTSDATASACTLAPSDFAHPNH